MRSLLRVADKTFVLTSEQLETILGVLFDAPTMHDEYVGNNKGDDGTQYIKILKRVIVTDGLLVNTMPDAYIDALEFKTKLHLESKSK
jgi:hypothetical protein